MQGIFGGIFCKKKKFLKKGIMRLPERWKKVTEQKYCVKRKGKKLVGHSNVYYIFNYLLLFNYYILYIY